MTISFDTFKSSEFTGSMNKLPGCQLLNDKTKAGLFVKEEGVRLSGWTGTKNDGEKYTHMYNNGDKSTGLFFASPRMHIVLVSPRYIELTKKGAQAGHGKRGDIMGIYPDDQELYQFLGEGATLRTFYLLYLVNAKNENLHKVPLVLSVHGVAAAQFGRALEQFYMMVDTAYAEREKTGYRPLNDQAHVLCVFNPTFEVDMAGQEEKSPVCVAKTFAEPKPETLDKVFCFDKAESLWAIQQSSATFGQKYMKQVEKEVGVHRIAPGVDVLPPANDSELDDINF